MLKLHSPKHKLLTVFCNARDFIYLKDKLPPDEFWYDQIGINKLQCNKIQYE